MTFTEKRKNQIKWYILEKIDNGQLQIASRTSEAFQISRNTVYRYIRELERDGIIKKLSQKYALVETHEHTLLSRENVDLYPEDALYAQHIVKHLIHLPENVQKIWQYTFMEMMNNAAEHSQASTIQLSVYQNFLNTTILISDNGIGIFQKIKEFCNFLSIDDAVNELYKGKLTTDSSHHSGEGIFFTSRILDCFAAISDGKIFSHNKYFEMPQLFDGQNISGTTILMTLSNYSRKSLKEVFDKFSDSNGGFTRTHIPLKNFHETFPVSRSQAKRLCHRLELFQEVELDFDEIEEIGQGFAHELFVVFQSAHPNVKLIPLNTSIDVKKMIYHVTQRVA